MGDKRHRVMMEKWAHTMGPGFTRSQLGIGIPMGLGPFPGSPSVSLVPTLVVAQLGKQC